MGFKAMVAADIKNVFFDVNAFGELHRVEGKEIPIVLATDELIERQGGQDLAVAESGTLFYAHTEDLPPRRTAGQSLNVDGRECLVDSWQVDAGVAIIALRENIIA